MSNSNAPSPRIELQNVLSLGFRLLARPVQFVGFWLAIALPLIYLPLLIGGLTLAEGLTFAALIVLNLVALVAGHGYAR